MTKPESSPPFEHLQYLDGWRGLAITFLLIGHFLPVPGINLGTVGVNLFFVLSGYLMGQLLFVKETPITVFYRRRISRIVPAHFFFVVCVTAFHLVSSRPVAWDETFAALLFVNNYVPGEVGHAVMPFGHIWSLSVEEHSYILLSIVAIAARRQWLPAKWMVTGLACCFSAFGFWYWTRYTGAELEFGKWLHSEVSAYGIFVSASLLLLLRGRRLPRLPAIAYLALIGGGILLHWWSVPSPFRTTIGVGTLALTVNLLANAPDVVKQALSFKPLRMMGLLSFSIYLWQQPFYLASRSGAMPTSVALVLAIGCGAASFYLLERPVRAYLNRVWGRSRVAGLAVSH